MQLDINKKKIKEFLILKELNQQYMIKHFKKNHNLHNKI